MTTPHELSDSDIAEILAMLPKEPPHGLAIIRQAAYSYWNLQDRAPKSGGRGVRKDLKDLAGKCRALGDLLEAPPLDLDLLLFTIPVFLDGDESYSKNSHRKLAHELTTLADRAEQFLKMSGTRMTGLDPTIDMTLSMLEIVYCSATGRSPTHSSHETGQHVGEPRSEFGRLVVAFFKVVDPDLTKTRLTTMVRNFVQDPQRKEVAAINHRLSRLAHFTRS